VGSTERARAKVLGNRTVHLAFYLFPNTFERWPITSHPQDDSAKLKTGIPVFNFESAAASTSPSFDEFKGRKFNL
jgi:hypothetical protein